MATAGGMGGGMPQRDRPIGGMGSDIRKNGVPLGGGAAPVNVYDQSAGNLTAATNAAQGAAAYTPQTLAETNLAPYQDPYQQQVIDTTMADMNRANQMALNNVGAQATQAGAYGGSRLGVAEAETNRAFMDQAARMSAGLNSQGYQNAQQGAMFDINSGMQGQGLNLQAAGQLGNLSNLGFGFGQSIGNQQMRDGTIQQGVQQALIDAGKSQYQGWAGQPGTALQYPLAALGVAPGGGGSTTEKQNPGLFNFLSLGLGLL